MVAAAVVAQCYSRRVLVAACLSYAENRPRGQPEGGVKNRAYLCGRRLLGEDWCASQGDAKRRVGGFRQAAFAMLALHPHLADDVCRDITKAGMACHGEPFVCVTCHLGYA